MSRKPKHSATVLNNYDKKIIEQYNGFHSGFIESYIPKTEFVEESSNTQKR